MSRPQIDDANMVLPLASSYNERGLDGANSTITRGIDQRKINSMYETAHNSMTGASTLYLVKRPGVQNEGNINSSTTQTSYLLTPGPVTSILDIQPWLFGVETTHDIQASNGFATTTIFNSSVYFPAYATRTAISAVDTLVAQFVRNDFNAQRVFFANSIGSWTEITDADFTGLVHRGKMEAMDGYFFTLDSMNRIYNSDLNSLASWTPTNFITKQVQQDIPVGLARLNNQIIAFGLETMEVFTNAGNPTGSPLTSARSLFQKVGMPRPYSAGMSDYYVVLGSMMYFLGTSAGYNYSQGIYVYDGSSAHRISTDFIDKILSNRVIFRLSKISFSGKTAIAIALTAPAAASQEWLMYFPEWNDWFEWTSSVFQPITDGKTFAGLGTSQGVGYQFAPGLNTWQDDQTAFSMIHQFKLPKTDNSRDYMGMCGVKGDTANPPSASKYLSLPGAVGDYVSTPSATANQITGDIDIRAYVNFASYMPSSQITVVGKFNSTSGQRSYAASIDTTGKMVLFTSADGSTTITHGGGTAIPTAGGTPVWLRWTLDVDNGAAGNTATFYTSADGISWSQLGATVVIAGITSIFAGSAILEVGGINAGAAQDPTGIIYQAQVYNGIAGSLVVSMVPGDAAVNSASWVSLATGETWTANGAASITCAPMTVEFSDDDWNTFYTAGSLDMTRRKKHIYQCGSYHDRGVRLTHSGNFEIRLESFLARIA